jgi:branched-chain amino acid aminotransferase
MTSGMDPRLNQSGPTLIVLAEHKPPVYAKTGLSLITSKIRRPPPDVLDARIHHANLLNSILAKIEANNAGADDALMLDTRGFVAETNATHVFIVRNSESRTNGDLATGLVRPCSRFVLPKRFVASRLICHSSMSMVRMKCFARGQWAN